MKKFWNFRNSAGSDSAELLLYGDLASEESWFYDVITPQQFISDLNSAIASVSSVSVRINSGGGDVFAAQTIGNYLEQCGKPVTAYIDGLCASAATIVACHCGKVIAGNDTTYMIHPVSMYCGYMTKDDLQSNLDAITKIQENIVNLYAKKSGHSAEETAAWMDATSWWTAEEARDNGFIDELTDEGGNTVVENRGGVLFVNSVSMNRSVETVPGFLLNRTRKTEPKAKPKAKAKPKKEESVMDIKTVEDLCKAYPDFTDALVQAAEERAAADERSRIQAIEDMALPGCEALTAEAKFTKPMSASDYAVAVVKETKARGGAWLDASKRDADNSGVNDVKDTPAPIAGSGRSGAVNQAKADAAKYLEQRKKKDRRAE